MPPKRKTRVNPVRKGFRRDNDPDDNQRASGNEPGDVADDDEPMPGPSRDQQQPVVDDPIQHPSLTSTLQFDMSSDDDDAVLIPNEPISFQVLQIDEPMDEGLRENDEEIHVGDEPQRERRRIDGRVVTYLSALGNDVNEFYLGIMDAVCDNCQAKHFSAERPADRKFTRCCRKGKMLMEPRDYPQLMENLLCGRHEHSANFMQNIRKYNSALAFASTGVQIEFPPGVGPYCFRIHGQIYHHIAHIERPVGNISYGQLYFLDSAEAQNHRLTRRENEECIPELMRELDGLLREINPFAEAYKFLREVEAEEKRRAEAEGTIMSDITMSILEDRRNDRRRYNFPTTNEVAVVFRSDDGAPPLERDIRVHARTGMFRKLSILSPNCDPLSYPLLFPRGEPGWQPNMPYQQRTARRENVSLLQYCSYHLAVRVGHFNAILNAGKLTQQLAVDWYVKIEGSRLEYFRQNQQKLRVELYRGLMDHLHAVAEENQARVGKMVILPPTFEGSPRNMHQNFQDAMTIVTKYGRPDLFITFTCNPKWREVTENLEPWQKAEHRPDLIARVFQLKLKELLHDIRFKHVLGVPVAYLHVIEFQKRGLPHCHILVILRHEDKPRESEQVDRIVCAEIPDPETEPELYAIVKTTMIHGPCGTLTPNSPCMSDGECTKNFPKEFRDETVVNEGGYPKYRRRDIGRTVHVRGHEVDNRYVVPYNKWLLKKFNAHINVEICSSIKSVKYICKYVYKGHDCACIRMGNEDDVVNWDELETFVDARYVSAPEAIWRIFEYKMHDRSHVIKRLAIHLPMEQAVYFQEGNEQQAVERAAAGDTTLTAWFKLNIRNPAARNYLYTDIPIHFVFNKKTWTERKKHVDTISRMYSVSPRDEERYYLRLLLLHVKGATSFEDMRTVNGEVFRTFKDAARQRNLLADDSEWTRCMREAATFKMPRQLRSLFATIMIFCELDEPQRLWEQFIDDLIDDFARTHDRRIAEDLALSDIQNNLALHGHKLTDFGFEQPQNHVIQRPEDDFNAEIERTEADRMREMLNADQLKVFAEVMRTVENAEIRARYFYLDGVGGAGKTFLYNVLISALRGMNVPVIAVAWTGIASLLLKGGRTVHSQFKLPVPLLDTSTSGLKPGTPQAEVINAAKVIIWDEITMAPAMSLIAVDRVLRDITRVERPFGGKVVLLGGDFRQCLPVVRNANRAKVVENCVKNCHLWTQFKTFSLTRNMRANAEETDFSKWLREVGEGKLENHVDLPDNTIAIPDVCMVEDVVSEIFNKNALTTDGSIHKNAILCPRNEDCKLINERIIDLLEGQAKSYNSVDSIVTDDEEERSNFSVEFLNSITPSGLPPHKLTLKIGTIIMLLRNLQVRQGLCNGTRLIVKNLMENCIDAEIITGRFEGNRVFIPRLDLTSADSDLPFKLKRRQFPIRPAYAMTINKAQGSTLEKVGIYLSKPVFAHGQLYVAFSRARAMNAVRVQILDTPKQGKLIEGSATSYTVNVVYKEVLEN